jgi:hypothetical protein
MSENVFLKPVDSYQRNLDPLKNYIDQNSFYLSKMSDRPIDDCRAFIVNGLKSKAFPEMRNPVVNYFERGENGDKYQTAIDLHGYINTAIRDRLIVAPTFTCYLNPDEMMSFLSEFAIENKNLRNIAKAEMFKAKVNDDVEGYILKNNEQDNAKRGNNSLSGCFGTTSSVHKNDTGHSTLTSTVRLESSVSNASNEKIISGNRHYYSPSIVMNNLISITSGLDLNAIDNVVSSYGLIYPSVQDVIDCIKWSSDFYWTDRNCFKDIVNFIIKLTPTERAGFVYTSDLYHIRKHNPEFIRRFFGAMSAKVTDKVYDDPISVIKGIDDQMVNLTHHITLSMSRGKGKEYHKYTQDELNILAGTSEHIRDTMLEYKDFIDTFFLTNNMPGSTAYIPGMVRRCVMLSDTDSTIFSVDEHVLWYFDGKLDFSDEQYGVATTVMYIATQCIAHLLAMMSANIGIAKNNLFKIAMKPEFTFPVFVQTSVAKHYYTCTLVREGNVYSEPELEVKGVNLKSSATPKIIIQEAHANMEHILNTIQSGQKLSLLDQLTMVGNLERKLTASLLNGDIVYFKQGKVKNKEAYVRDEDGSPYAHYKLWNSIFAPKYGVIPEPPYSTIKIPTTAYNITGLKAWLDVIEDKEFASRVSDWVIGRGKKELPSIYLPIGYVKSFGIPEEVKQVMDIKSIILDLTYVFRATLESVGFLAKEGRLISEHGY